MYTWGLRCFFESHVLTFLNFKINYINQKKFFVGQDPLLSWWDANVFFAKERAVIKSILIFDKLKWPSAEKGSNRGRCFLWCTKIALCLSLWGPERENTFVPSLGNQHISAIWTSGESRKNFFKFSVFFVKKTKMIRKTSISV